MRKISREMPADWALEVLQKAPYITLSLVDTTHTDTATPTAHTDNADTNTTSSPLPYAVPLSMAYVDDAFYFHCAPEGRKLDILRAHHRVFLSAVSHCRPTVGPLDNSFTLQYKSAMAEGIAEIVDTDEEKILALRAISERFLPQHMPAFDQAIARSLHRTAVVRIRLTAPPTGKRKQYDDQGEEMKFGRMQ